MKIIRTTPSENGGISAPYTWNYPEPDDGCAWFPAEFEAEFQAYNGFVILEIDGDTVTAMTPNIEAWEAWKASLPPEPEPEGDPIEFIKGLMEVLGNDRS